MTFARPPALRRAAASEPGHGVQYYDTPWSESGLRVRSDRNRRIEAVTRAIYSDAAVAGLGPDSSNRLSHGRSRTVMDGRAGGQGPGMAGASGLQVQVRAMTGPSL